MRIVWSESLVWNKPTEIGYSAMEIQWEWLDILSTGLKVLLLCLAIVDTLLESLSDMIVTEKHGYCFRGEEF